MAIGLNIISPGNFQLNRIASLAFIFNHTIDFVNNRMDYQNTLRKHLEKNLNLKRHICFLPESLMACRIRIDLFPEGTCPLEH